MGLNDGPPRSIKSSEMSGPSNDIGGVPQKPSPGLFNAVRRLSQRQRWAIQRCQHGGLRLHRQPIPEHATIPLLLAIASRQQLNHMPLGTGGRERDRLVTLNLC
jgi:hypothetical protein